MFKKLLVVCLLTMVAVTGCKSGASTLEAADFEVTDDNTTSKGVKVGDDSESFKAAYKDYTIQVASISEGYKNVTMDEISFDDEINTMISTFIIDGKAISNNDICDKYKIEKSQLLSLLTSASFLAEHTITYDTLEFYWSGGKITEIVPQSTDFNSEYGTTIE